MKKILSLLFAVILLSSVARSQTCTISGQISGLPAGTSGRTAVVVKEVIRAGYLFPMQNYTVPMASNGSFRIVVPQTIGTDTTKIRIYADVPGWRGVGGAGEWMNVPHGATALLSSLTHSTVSQSYPFIATLTSFVDSAGGVYVNDTLRFGAGLRVIQSPTGGPPTLIATGSGTGDMLKADSNKATSGGFATVQFVYDNAGTGGSGDTTGTTNRPEMTNIENDVKTVRDIAGGKGDSDSLKAAADTLAAHRTQIDTKQNTLSAAQIARLDSSLAEGYAISITSSGTIKIIAVDTTGFFAAFGGVMTESDPTAIKADTASLAVLADQMYPRSASGGSADSSVSVSKTQNETVWGNKDFDGTLTVDNINQDKDSSFNAGTVNARALLIDSTGYVQLDSIMYKVMGGVAPSWYEGLGGGGSKRSSVTFHVRSSKRVNATLRQFDVVSDTAQGWYVVGVYAKTFGLYATDAPGVYFSNSAFVENYVYNDAKVSTTLVTWIAATERVMGDAARSVSMVPRIMTIGSRGIVQLAFTESNDGSHFRSEITVELYNLSGSETSAWLAKITNAN
jgi:hypothetical protein